MSTTIPFIPFQVHLDGFEVFHVDADFQAIDGLVERQVRTQIEVSVCSDTDTRTTAGLSEWQRKKIIRFVDSNIHERLRVFDLSEQVRLSVSRFSKGFNVTFGRPPYDYVLSRRIEAAKYLIASTSEPLSQIAHACGLSDQAHLTKVFKRLAGTTPLKWRRNASVTRSTQWDYLTDGSDSRADQRGPQSAAN